MREPNTYPYLFGNGYLLRLDAKGHPVWEKKLPDSLGRSNANQIKEDRDGSLILAATINNNMINQGHQVASIDTIGNFTGLKYGVTEMRASYRGMKATSKIYVY